MTHAMQLVPGRLTLRQLHDFARSHERLALDGATRDGLARGASAVAAIVESGRPAYGVNTGFGKLAQTQIPREDLELLQRNLILSHSVGGGPLLSDEVVRLGGAVVVAP